MRVALACPYAWDDAGGVQVHVRELGSRLKDRGHDVIVLAPARGRPSEQWVVRVGKPLDVSFNRSSAPVSPFPSTWRRVRRALEAFRPDVIHVHEPAAPSAALFAAISPRAPVVATFHSGVGRSALYDAAGPFLRRGLRPVHERIAVSQRAADAARRRLGGRYVLIPNGIDLSAWSSAEAARLGEGTKLLFVGRLDPRKGFGVALRAFEQLTSTRPDLRLIVAGDGPERSLLTRLAAEARERVTMLGTVPNADIPSIAAACQIFIASSIGGESFGVVIAEAMAAGLAIVASDIPGYDEVARDGVDSILVDPGDPRAIAQAVAGILDEPEKAETLRKEARERARRFDWDPIVDRIEAVYQRAAGRMRP